MANGLLNSLVEYWEPNVALGSLKGMVAGLNMSLNGLVSVVSDNSFPGGFAMSINSGNVSRDLETAIDPLLSEWGLEDFAVLFCGKIPVGQVNAGLAFYINGDNSNGVFCGGEIGSSEPYGQITGSDASFPIVSTSGNPWTDGVTHFGLFWWTVNNLTLHLQVDNGTEFTNVSPINNGPSDPTNYATLSVIGDVAGPSLAGAVSIWRGAEGVANALSQRALLFGGLPFSQWDSGGASGGVTFNTNTHRREGSNPPMQMVGGYKRGSYARR